MELFFGHIQLGDVGLTYQDLTIGTFLIGSATDVTNFIIIIIIVIIMAHSQEWKEAVIYKCSSVHYLSFRNSMIPFKNLPINCGVPLLVAKIPSINDDAHSLRILASLSSLKNIFLKLAISGALPV